MDQSRCSRSYAPPKGLKTSQDDHKPQTSHRETPQQAYTASKPATLLNPETRKNHTMRHNNIPGAKNSGSEQNNQTHQQIGNLINSPLHQFPQVHRTPNSHNTTMMSSQEDCLWTGRLSPWPPKAIATSALKSIHRQTHVCRECAKPKQIPLQQLYIYMSSPIMALKLQKIGADRG